jgi:hypothetical protein
VTASRSFREEMIGLRDATLPFLGGGIGCYHPVKVRPSLGFALVPRPREREDKDGEAPEVMSGPRPRRAEVGRLCRLMAASAAAGAEPPLGLVEGGNSDAGAWNPRRHGLHGLTHAGGRFLEDFCSAVREDKWLYGFWTVTLPPQVAEELDNMCDGAQRFSDALRRRFGEALRRAADREVKRSGLPCPDHWAFVIEPQTSGRPHWHFVFRCKRTRWGRWLLTTDQLDALIENAFCTVTGKRYTAEAAGNVGSIRKSPGHYLSSYLKKGVGETAAHTILLNGWSFDLIPHRWWGASRSALALVRSLTWELPWIVVNMLSREWPGLAAAGVIDARIWQPDSDGAPAIVCGRWRSLERLAGVLDVLLGMYEAPYPVCALQ